MPTEFDHITVPSQDLEKSIVFYTSLGMQLIEYELQHHAHFENKEHEVIFTVYFNKIRPSFEVKIHFEVSDIEVFETRFRESALRYIPLTTWGGRELHLADPDQNRVILYQVLSESSIPPWQKETG